MRNDQTLRTVSKQHNITTANFNIYPEDPVSMKTDHSEFQKVNIHERAKLLKLVSQTPVIQLETYSVRIIKPGQLEHQNELKLA